MGSRKRDAVVKSCDYGLGLRTSRGDIPYLWRNIVEKCAELLKP